MTKKALLIGINYIDTNVALRGCINDVNNINNILKTNNFNITMLTDTSTVKPIKQNIINSLKWLINDCKSGDTLLFYYCGHGSQIKDTDGDESDKLDEVIVPLDYRKNGVITDDFLYDNIKLKGGVNFYGFTDCCHSGSICDLKFNYTPSCGLKQGIITNGMPYIPLNWTDTFTTQLLTKDYILGNIFFISGCKDNQISEETNTSQGAFTVCFLKFLRENIINGIFVNNKFKLKDILKYIHCNLQMNRFKQVPVMSSNKETTSFFNL